ncbi:sphingomyelin phosphodiesterase [Calliopsis andreniformis]|uniref:sphingomyelin phosphodiesterase n=1 Tax=Calliopsis andreniformis TaxID=337506 RepID=UPI003FCC47B2
MTQYLKIPTELQNSDWRTFSAEKGTAICTICQGTVGTFIKLRRRGMSEQDIAKKIINLCTLMNIQTPRVCKGVVELNLPIIMYIVDSRPNLTANTICGVVLESKSCPLTNPEYNWSININKGPNVVVGEHNVTEHNVTEEINILQLTDFHYDPEYEPNGNTNCGEPVCCRKGQNTTNANSLAGFWGDYASCDTPWHSIIDVFSHIKQTHQNIDYIYFTGDIIDHGVWETSKNRNKRSIQEVYNKIRETFKDTQVYPILGNHEPHPLNQFAPKTITDDNLTTNWLYELLADLWISYGWLPESTRSTIHQGGYYTVSPKKGFRIIALNSNVCYSYNWWLLYRPKDPDGQLQWFANTLSKAEENKEFVHILSHIPINSNSCLNTWKQEYLKIIDRFSHLIKAEFNGHTHTDEIGIFYNSNGVAKNIAWNGGSITAYSKLNPNYKIYTVNNSNYAVNDYQNWMYDLGSANQNINKRPKWYKSYSFRNEYGLPNISTTSLNNLLHKVASNETLLNKYYRNFYKLAKPSLQENCNVDCKKQYLCRTIAYAGNKNVLCDNILKG